MVEFILGAVIGLIVGWLFIPCPQFITDWYAKLKG